MSSVLPGVIERVVTKSAKVFKTVQELRYDNDTNGKGKSSSPSINANTTIDAAGIHNPTLSATSVWLEQYAQLLKNEDCPQSIRAFWSLATELALLIENNGDISALVIAPTIREWFAKWFVSTLNTKNKLKGGRRVSVLQNSAPKIFENLRLLFVTGQFEEAAELLDDIIECVREMDPDILTAEDESAFIDLKQLMMEAYNMTEEKLNDWKTRATNALFSLQGVLEKRRSSTRKVTSCEAVVAQELGRFCLEALLMISGDEQNILEWCLKHKQNLLIFTVAVGTMTRPFATLAEVYEICQDEQLNSIHSDSPDFQWVDRVFTALLSCSSMNAFCSAAQMISQTAMDLGWQGDYKGMYTVSEDEDSDGEFSEGLFNPDALEQCSKLSAPGVQTANYFFLTHMAAHIADLSGFMLIQGDVQMLHVRNGLISNYISMFSPFVSTFKCAFMYLGFSPLMNPAVYDQAMQEMVEVLLHTGEWTDAEDLRDAWDNLIAFGFNMWDADSATQAVIRRALNEGFRLDRTLNLWFDALEQLRQTSWRESHVQLVRWLMDRKEYADAVRAAVVARVDSCLVDTLVDTLRSDQVLQDDFVWSVGRGVLCGHIPCLPPAKQPQPQQPFFGQLLHLYGALSAYRQRASVLELKRGTSPGTGTTEDKLDCLEAIEVCLKVLEQMTLFIAPHPLLSIVEHAADILLQLQPLFPAGATQHVTPLFLSFTQLYAIQYSYDNGVEQTASRILEKLLMRSGLCCRPSGL